MNAKGGGQIANTLKSWGRNSLSGMLDLLLPNVCGGCNCEATPRGRLCDRCTLQLLSLVALPYCPRCGGTLGPNVPAYPDGCRSCPSPLPRFASVFRLGPYAHPLRFAIKQLKYHRRTELLRRMCVLLAERISAEDDPDLQPDLIVPVPQHWQRRLSRGVDHASLLAEGLARQLDLPLSPELIRIRNTPQQARMPRTQRLASVRGAFTVADEASLRGARVLLVDDVTTTGATANECARTLLAAGATRVALAVLAKAEPPAAYTQHWET